MKARKFLLTYLPTFCWQDFDEIVRMFDKYLEPLTTDVCNIDSLATTLCELVKLGKIEATILNAKNYGRLWHGKRGFTYVYRRSPSC